MLSFETPLLCGRDRLSKMVLAYRSSDVSRATRLVWLLIAKVVIAYHIDEETACELVCDLDCGTQVHSLLILLDILAPRRRQDHHVGGPRLRALNRQQPLADSGLKVVSRY